MPLPSPFKKRKRQRYIFVTLLHRGSLSLGDNRKRLGSEAYHWGIFVANSGTFQPTSKIDGLYLDVTNGLQPHPEDEPDALNPEGNWYFRSRRMMSPQDEIRMLCMVCIGAMPGSESGSESGLGSSIEEAPGGEDCYKAVVTEALRQLPLPDKEVKSQHCVWWTLNAVQALQSRGWVPAFDIADLEVDGTSFADLSMQALQRKTSARRVLLKIYPKKER